MLVEVLMLLSSDVAITHAVRCVAVWFQSAMKMFGGLFLCLSSAQSLHDLISMTLMKGRGLLDEVDGLIGLLTGQERRNLFIYFMVNQHVKTRQMLFAPGVLIS